MSPDRHVIYNFRIDFKGNLTELANDAALISGY